MVVITEEKNGLEYRYINAQDGMKVYLLPIIPKDVGQIPVQEDLDESVVEDYMKELGFSLEQTERTRTVLNNYRGRQLDTLSILGYAKEHSDKAFNTFAKELEERKKDFETIHPDLMYARTDVSAFFMGLYGDLGKVPAEIVKKTTELAENYGPGIVVLAED